MTSATAPSPVRRPAELRTAAGCSCCSRASSRRPARGPRHASYVSMNPRLAMVRPSTPLPSRDDHREHAAGNRTIQPRPDHQARPDERTERGKQFHVAAAETPQREERQQHDQSDGPAEDAPHDAARASSAEPDAAAPLPRRRTSARSGPGVIRRSVTQAASARAMTARRSDSTFPAHMIRLRELRDQAVPRWPASSRRRPRNSYPVDPRSGPTPRR